MKTIATGRPKSRVFAAASMIRPRIPHVDVDLVGGTLPSRVPSTYHGRMWAQGRV
jgi:hypothetical protein